MRVTSIGDLPAVTDEGGCEAPALTGVTEESGHNHLLPTITEDFPFTLTTGAVKLVAGYMSPVVTR